MYKICLDAIKDLSWMSLKDITVVFFFPAFDLKLLFPRCFMGISCFAYLQMSKCGLDLPSLFKKSGPILMPMYHQ